jgi:hypothetical protein
MDGTHFAAPAGFMVTDLRNIFFWGMSISTRNEALPPVLVNPEPDERQELAPAE